MEKPSEQLTFRDLDGIMSIGDPTWPLEVWYAEVRDTKIGELSVGDLARSCRQNLHLEAIVPRCLEKLQAGELYDGELLTSLKKVSSAYWASHPSERMQFLRLAARAYQQTGDADLRATEQDLLGGKP